MMITDLVGRTVKVMNKASKEVVCFGVIHGAYVDDGDGVFLVEDSKTHEIVPWSLNDLYHKVHLAQPGITIDTKSDVVADVIARAMHRESGLKLEDELALMTEVKSNQEWLDSWGEGPHWADPKGVTVPMTKTTLKRLLDGILRMQEDRNEWKKRAADAGCILTGTIP